jgi:hypothetical protein
MDFQGTVTCDHRVGDPVQAYMLNTCPRCLGTGKYGGPNFLASGAIETLQGSKQLSQQIRKILAENKRESGYGFDYRLLRGVIDTTTVGIVRNEIIRCLFYLRDLQIAEKKSGTAYSPTEQLDTSDQFINFVNVFQDSSEPRKLRVEIAVTTISGAQASASTVLKR